MKMRTTPWMLAAATLFAPVSTRAAPAKARVQKTTVGGPQLAYERFRQQVQVEVAAKREAQITGLVRLLELGPPPEEIPDLRFRLAELYADKARAAFFAGQEKDDAMLRASEEQKASLQAEKTQAAEDAKAWAQNALEVYSSIRAEHPNYARMPEVLFALGQSYWTAGQFEDSLEPYADLIRRFEKSPLVAEAWIAFGEYYFNEGDVRKALKSYENAAENKRSRVYGFALYKQAWCFYNMAEWRKALRKFEATVLFSQLSEEMSGENKIALGREAQADWVRTYVHVGSSDRARFEIAELLDLEKCTGRCLKLLEGLAGLWMEEGYFDASADVYRQLTRLEPESLRNPLRQAKVVDLVDRMGDKSTTVEEAKKLVAIFSAAKKRFAAMPAGTEKEDAEIDLDEAGIISEGALRRLAQEWNKEARKTRQEATFGRAEGMYRSYLEIFPDAAQAYNMRFQYADLLYKLERFDDAAKNYRVVVEAKPEDGTHLIEAANDNILAVEEHLRDLRLKLPEDLKAPTDLHPQHQRLVDAAQRYLKLVPAKKAGDKLPAVKLKVARVFYAYNRFEPALEGFDELVRSHPRSEQAVVAANLVVDVHNLNKDWSALYAAARRYLDDADLVDGRPELKSELARFGEYAKFALIQQLKEKLEGEKADVSPVASGFEEFYREFPKSDKADQALFNASVLWDKLGERGRADRLRATLLDEYPQSKLRADVAFYVAKQHEQRTEYGAAAKAYQRFAKEFPKDERARDALFDASVFHAATGRTRTAAKIREIYLGTYGRDPKAKDELQRMEFAIAEDLEKGRRLGEAAKAYGRFVKKHGPTELGFDAMWREAKVRRRLRQRRTAEKLERRILGTVLWMKKKRRKVPVNANRYAALVTFSLLDPDFQKYRKTRLKTPSLRNPKPFQRSLRDLARARDRVIQRYESVVTDYKEAESSLASLYRIARAWDVFGDAIEKLPCPRGTPAEICDTLASRLQELTSPARASATQAYAVCVERSVALKTFTEYADRCARRLEAVAPDRLRPSAEKVVSAPPRATVSPEPSHALILDRAPAAPSGATASREVTP